MPIGEERMMNIFGAIKRVILWSYERGSWQYDILCVVILAFIFLTPGHIFDERLSAAEQRAAQAERTYVPIKEVMNSSADHTHLRDLLGETVSQRYQRKLTVKRFEVDADSDGRIRGYRVWID